jgi:hypothetical protein
VPGESDAANNQTVSNLTLYYDATNEMKDGNYAGTLDDVKKPDQEWHQMPWIFSAALSSALDMNPDPLLNVLQTPTTNGLAYSYPIDTNDDGLIDYATVKKGAWAADVYVLGNNGEIDLGLAAVPGMLPNTNPTIVTGIYIKFRMNGSEVVAEGSLMYDGGFALVQSDVPSRYTVIGQLDKDVTFDTVNIYVRTPEQLPLARIGVGGEFATCINFAGGGTVALITEESE